MKLSNGLISNPSIAISWGELADKLTILHIKSRMLTDAKALLNVNKEKVLLEKILEESSDLTGLSTLQQKLSEVNLLLWGIEDQIREKERLQEFDDEFIQLARSVYKQNDRRAHIKREINVLMQSDLFEEKSYKKY